MVIAVNPFAFRGAAELDRPAGELSPVLAVSPSHFRMGCPKFAQMNRRPLAVSLRLWSITVAVACPYAGASSATPPSLCEQLAIRMRESPTTVLKDATATPSPGFSPWVIPAKSQAAESEEVYNHIAAIWRKRLGPWPDKTIQTLPGTDLYMARTIAGSLDCLQYMFIEWKRGGIPRLLDDPQIGVGACARLSSWGDLATVLGRPVYVESASLDPSGVDSLLGIAPWLGGNWGRPCRVSIRYTYQSSATQQYCAATQALCTAARETAAEAERPYHAWDASFTSWFNESPWLPAPKFRYRIASSPEERALVARAQRLGTRETAASGSGANPAWLRDLNHSDAYYFPLRLSGKLYVAALADEVYPSSDSLFFLFQAPRADSERLVPLAVFTMHWGAAGLKSINARE
jgi:hypothetical protein